MTAYPHILCLICEVNGQGHGQGQGHIKAWKVERVE